MTDDEEDVEMMLLKWNDLDRLTLQGLRVLRQTIDKAIEGRVRGGETYDGPDFLAPPHPGAKPCYGCLRWITTGEDALLGTDGSSFHVGCTRKSNQ